MRPDISNKMRGFTNYKPVATWAGRTGLYMSVLAVVLAGCSSMSKTIQQPAKPVTVSASLQNDPYPDLRQLTPEQSKQLEQKQALVKQLGTPGANQRPAHQTHRAPHQVQNAAPVVTGSTPPRRLAETSTQQAVPQNPSPAPVQTAQVVAQNPATPQPQAGQPQPQVSQPKISQPQTPASKPKVEAKKSSGYFGWLGSISAKRAAEQTPAEKLRAARKLLASQRQDIDQTQLSQNGPGAAITQTPVAPARVTPPASQVRPQPSQIVQGPPSNTKVTPVKRQTALKITKPAKPKRPALKPSRVDTKPVNVAKRPVRRPAPRARAVKREPVEVARIGSNSRPVTTASVPQKEPQTRSVATPAANLPTKSRPIRVYFSKDSAQISPRDVSRLSQLASMQKSTGRRVYVRAIAAAGPNGEAEADANALNKLAVSRAKAVATKLWGYGVKSDQMVLQASQEQAIGQGRSTLQAARIRRAEIYIE